MIRSKEFLKFVVYAVLEAFTKSTVPARMTSSLASTLVESQP